LLAVNSSYIAYAVKKGLVRVIDRRSSAKALLRGHGSRIVDAAFFGENQKEGIGGLWKELAAARTGDFSTVANNAAGANGGAASAASDILATIGGLNDSLFIWRVYNDRELQADKLIELKFGPGSSIGCPSRILWHPFDPNRFMLLHRKGIMSVASLVETKRLVTKRAEEGHMVCKCDGDIPGATQFIISDGEASSVGVNDVSWSGKDARHILTAHDDGIRLWDVIAPVVQTEDKKSFQCIAKIPMGEVTRVVFLSRYEHQGDAITPPFVTGMDMNHTIALWGGFSASGKAKKLTTFTLKVSDPSISTLMSVELIPAPYRPSDTTPSSFILLSERENARMHALHLATEWKSTGVHVSGFDYVTTLDVVHPILSQCIAASDSNANLDEERDVELCCVQTKAVQLISVSGEMVAAPKSMEVPSSVTVVEEEENEAEEFEEDYDMDDEPQTEFSTEHDTDDVVSNDEPAAVNPFSNWLGALATGSATAPPPPMPPASKAPPPPPGLDFMFPPPPPPGMAPTNDVKGGMSFLSPMELLGKSEPTPDPILSNDAKKDGKKSTIAPSSASNLDASSLESALERIMTNHMKSMENNLLDVVKKTVAIEVEKAMNGNKVKNVMEKSAKECAGIAAREAVGSMQTPIVTTLHQVSLYYAQ
jgi:WD40 repeat protein